MDLSKMDIERVARADEKDAGQSQPHLRESLAEAKAGAAGRVTAPAQIMLRVVRKKSGLSQAEFARRINTPAATLRDWEQGRSQPPGGVLCLLKLLDAHPDLVAELALA